MNELNRPTWIQYPAAGVLASIFFLLLEVLVALPGNHNLFSLSNPANTIALALVYLLFGVTAGFILGILKAPIRGNRLFVTLLGQATTLFALFALVHVGNLLLFALFDISWTATYAVAWDAVLGLIALWIAYQWKTKGVASVAWLPGSALVIVAALVTSDTIVSQHLIRIRNQFPGSPLEESFVQQARYPVPQVDPDPTRPNVLLICVDTLRADALGVYGNPYGTSPTVDAMAAQGVTFEHALAQSSWTVPSVASFFTGLYPHKAGATKPLNALPDFTTTFAEIFKTAGYSTGAFIANVNLGKEFAFHAGFDHYDDELISDDLGERLSGSGLLRAVGKWVMPENYQIATADKIVDRFLKWFDGVKDQQVLAYLHFMDPHCPYMPPVEVLHRLFPNDGPAFAKLSGANRDFSPEDKLALRKIYLAEVAFFDDQFGRMLAAYRKMTRRPTLLVFWSDHGEAFWEHGQFGHGKSLYREETWVPLIWRMEGVLPSGKIVKEPVALMDLMPTLCSLSGIPTAPWMQGRDLSQVLTGITPLPDRPIFAELDYVKTKRYQAYSVQVGMRKAIFDFQRSYQVAYQLDGGLDEKHPVPFDADPAFQTLNDLINLHLDSVKTGGVTPNTVDVDRKTLEKIKALGYIQ